MADAWAAFKVHKETEVDTGRSSSADSFGTREFLNGNYLNRMSAAVLGIYGNSKEEAIYPAYFVDADEFLDRNPSIQASLRARSAPPSQCVLVAHPL